MINEIRHIRAFLAVAKHSNFTRAAQELHVSQSALTVQIQQLEETLGVKLFDRNKRRVALTDAGRQVLDPLQRIVIDSEAIVSQTREITGLRRGIVSIALLPSVASGILAEVISRFTAEWNEDHQQYGRREPARGRLRGDQNSTQPWAWGTANCLHNGR